MDVKNLAEVVVLGAKAYKAFEEAKKDGKLDANDLLYIVPLVTAIEPALKDINLVPGEALDLDAAETEQLILLVQKEIPELAAAHDVLKKVKASVSFLLAAKDLYNAFAAKPVGNLEAALGVNSFEGEMQSEGSLARAIRADNLAAAKNAEEAAAKKAAIAAAREPKQEVAAAKAAEVTPEIPSA